VIACSSCQETVALLATPVAPAPEKLVVGPPIPYQFLPANRCSSTTFILGTPAEHLIPPSTAGTRKAAKPPLVCGFVATKRPNRVGERAGNAQRTGGGAEPRQNLKRGAGGARRRPTTKQRSRGCVPLDWGVHAHQAALSKSKKWNIPPPPRRTCGKIWTSSGLLATSDYCQLPVLLPAIHYPG
jgi:hypothetical protein